MAKLKKQVLGKISGALGDIVFREVNGKNVVGMKPSSFNIPNDPDSLARRAKFALSAKLAQAINKNQKLKDIWAVKSPSGQSTHNFLIKSNYINVLPADLTNLVKLVPDAGFPVSVSSNTISSAGIEINLNSIGDNNYIDPAIEINVQMFTVLFLNDALDETVEPFKLISAGSPVQSLSLSNPLTFNAPLIGNDELIFAKYQSQKAFSVFLTTDADGNVIHYSNTLSV